MIDEKPVAGLRKMTALKKTTEAISWRTAGDEYEHKLPGGTKYEPVTLEQGLTMEEIERRAILAALDKTGGNRTQAAEMLGIGLRTLQRKLKEYRSTGD